MQNNVSVEYLAGFFDGEGNISLRISPSTGLHTGITVQCANMVPTPLEALQKRFGGTIHQRRTATKSGRYLFVWNLQTGAYDALQVLLPFLLIKHEQARLAIEFVEFLRIRDHVSYDDRAAFADAIADANRRVHTREGG